MDKLFNKYLKEMEESVIHCDSNKLHIEGGKGALLSMYSQITGALAEDIDKKILEDAFNYAFMSEKELKKLALEKIKKLIEEVDKEKTGDKENGE